MAESILDSVKKVLGMEAGYTAFDLDIVMHVNSVFSTLQQIGVGPVQGYMITDNTQNWEDYLGENSNELNMVKSYMYLRVRLLFDPPATSFTIESMTKIADQLEWRLNVAATTPVLPVVVVDPTPDPFMIYSVGEETSNG